MQIKGNLALLPIRRIICQVKIFCHQRTKPSYGHSQVLKMQSFKDTDFCVYENYFEEHKPFVIKNFWLSNILQLFHTHTLSVVEESLASLSQAPSVKICRAKLSSRSRNEDGGFLKSTFPSRLWLNNTYQLEGSDKQQPCQLSNGVEGQILPSAGILALL